MYPTWPACPKRVWKLSIGVRYRTGMIEKRKPSMAANCSVFFKRENRRYEKTRSAVASHNPSKKRARVKLAKKSLWETKKERMMKKRAIRGRKKRRIIKRAPTRRGTKEVTIPASCWQG